MDSAAKAFDTRRTARPGSAPSPRREERQRRSRRIVGRELLVDDELEIGNRGEHQGIPSPVRHAAEGDERNAFLGRDARHGGRFHVLDDGAAARARSERLEELQEEVGVREGGGVSPDARYSRRRATRCAAEQVGARVGARDRSTPVGIGAVTLVAVGTGGLLPTAVGARARLARGRIMVTDGPFSEAKEVIGGFAIFDVPSKEEALGWTRRFLQVHIDHWPEWEGEIEVRQLFEGPPGA